VSNILPRTEIERKLLEKNVQNDLSNIFDYCRTEIEKKLHHMKGHKY